MTGSTIHRAFEEIYRQDAWSSGSGPGSSPANTIEYRAFLERFIVANAIRDVTDLGCGDWQFSRLIDWSGVRYVGYDVVDRIVAANRERYARDTVSFETFGTIEDLPGGDLLLAKEVLQHLPNETIVAYLGVIRARYRFALLTNATDPQGAANHDIPAGGYRPLRLDAAPFDVPGAVIFTYHPQSSGFTYKNVAYLVMGAGPAR